MRLISRRLVALSLSLAGLAWTLSWHRRLLKSSLKMNFSLLLSALLPVVSSAMDCILCWSPENFTSVRPGPASHVSPAGRKKGCLILGGGILVPTPSSFLGLRLSAESLSNKISADAAAVTWQLLFLHFQVSVFVHRHKFIIVNGRWTWCCVYLLALGFCGGSCTHSGNLHCVW